MRLTRMTALAAFALVVLFAAVAGSARAQADAAGPTANGAAQATSTLRIWTDRDREADVTRLARSWASRRGVSVQVVAKQEQNNIRSDFITVQADNAPDVIFGAHDWVGELASNGQIVALAPKASVRKEIPKYTRDAFSYGKTVSRLYGMPTHVENVGLFVNTRIARVPKTWTDLERQALVFQRRGGGRVGLAVQQGTGGDAYHMYPFFSGLGGYIFGKTRGGALNPRDIGLDSKRFLANASLIDRWNRERLINSKISNDQAQELFTSGKAAFWITGPWNIDTVKKAKIRFRIVQVPKIKYRSAPFLGVGGVMVTRFARGHGVQSAAKDFVGSFMASASTQTTLARTNNRYPANLKSAKQVRDPYLRQIGKASTGGVPMPNIPEMAKVWNDLGQAWVKSTRGSGATKASNAFRAAARAIRTALR